MIKSVNGKIVILTPEEEAEVLADQAAYDPLPELKKQLLAIERINAIEALLIPQKAQINLMNEGALRAAIAANGI